MAVGSVTGIPEFPAARVASAIDPEAVIAAGPVHEVVSDYQWLSLRCWNPEAELSILDGALAIAFHGYHDGTDRFFGFVGGDDPRRIADTLLTEAEQRGWEPALRLLPWSTAMHLVDHFDVASDRDNDDYLYDPAGVAELHGPEHRTNRNHRGIFRRAHAGVSDVRVHHASDAPWGRIIELTEEWASDAADSASAADESKAVLRCVATMDLHSRSRDVYVTTMEIDGSTVGYDVTELCSDGWALNHFRHAPRSRRGAHLELRSAVASWLAGRGVRSWNAEQDLGVPGLRARKLQDRPDGFVRKFVVRRAEDQA